MRVLKAVWLLMLTITGGTLMFCWRGLVWLVDVIDGGDDDRADDRDDLTSGQVIHYNHRTGDIDSVKRLDGLYDKSPQ